MDLEISIGQELELMRWRMGSYTSLTAINMMILKDLDFLSITRFDSDKLILSSWEEILSWQKEIQSIFLFNVMLNNGFKEEMNLINLSITTALLTKILRWSSPFKLIMLNGNVITRKQLLLITNSFGIKTKDGLETQMLKNALQIAFDQVPK